MVNIVAAKFSPVQRKYAFHKSFGSLYTSPSSLFFFRDWRTCYGAFSTAVEAAVSSGNQYFSEFDLVSFFELIDHGILRRTIAKKVRSEPLLDLLFSCLRQWTPNQLGELHHGLPQGPAPSAFLAECILFKMDSLPLKNVEYFRYVDDIRILARGPAPIRRALIQLDLQSKALGLVPQAQKITAPRKALSATEVTKSVPSMVLSASAHGRLKQSELYSLYRRSIDKDALGWRVTNVTHFKYGLGGLSARKRLLGPLASIAKRHPELASSVSGYLTKFRSNTSVADLIHSLLEQDPVYDTVAARYVEAMDVCEPSKGFKKYRTLINDLENNSVEKSLALPLACGTFKGRRIASSASLALIKGQKEKITRSLLIERLFKDPATSTFNIRRCQTLLEEMCCDEDPDLSRYAAFVLLTSGPKSWKKPPGSSPSVNRLVYGVGKTRRPKLPTALDVFFQSRLKIGVKLDWKKALGKTLSSVEQRCLRVQALATGDQSARMLIVDTFNDALLQKFCPAHPALATAYSAAAGNKHHPDLGAWLGQNNLGTVLPVTASWFASIHSMRLHADLSHASQSKGATPGSPTQPISKKVAEKAMRGARAAWTQLIEEWVKYV